MSEFKSWYSYWGFADRIRRQNRFIRTSEDEEFLLEIVRTSSSRIKKLPKNFSLWRAQLGHTWQPLYQYDESSKIPAAYPPERMKPQKSRATEGRANPKGIPVLYLSTHRRIAMCEVRPWLGSLVSCAEFKTTRPLEIVDLSVDHQERLTIYSSEPDPPQREKVVWANVASAFSEPMSSKDDTADYVPTQVIAELFKSEGYDGIEYKSAFKDDGHNIALFDLADAELSVCNLYRVASLDFLFEERDTPYWINNDGKIETISIEVIGPPNMSDNSSS